MTTTKISKKTEDLITRWVEADKQRAKWVTEEMNLRKEVAAALFANPVEGAGNKTRIGHGKAIQMTHKINRTIQQAEHDELRKKDNIAPLIAAVTKYKPELKVREFKALSDEDRNLIAPMITEKPGSPELEMKDENKIRW